jgi:hypothetical protein
VTSYHYHLADLTLFPTKMQLHILLVTKNQRQIPSCLGTEKRNSQYKDAAIRTHGSCCYTMRRILAHAEGYSTQLLPPLFEDFSGFLMMGKQADDE